MDSDPVRLAEPVRFGENFELDLRAYELRRAGRVLRLERIPMDLLVLLVEHRGELVSRDRIIEKIWGKDVFLDTDGSINSAIRKIRQVLRDDPEQPRFVLTVSGRGYRFIAPIEEAPPPPSRTADTLPPAVGSLPGQKISHYRVLQILGGGGMGVVYKAEDLKLGRMVALKFLPIELASDPVLFERLQREAQTASALDHPNICSIYQLDEHEGQPFIVMQLLEGQTLREWIETAAEKDPAARTANLLEVAIQIADGLAAAHEKGIIHRDIKPTNIFVTTRGRAKILDFGVAKFVDIDELLDAKSNAERTAGDGAAVKTYDPHSPLTGVSVDSPSYMSPEQIRREPLDARTDLFSFGLVLYEMATGRRAFSGNTTAVIRDSILHLPAVPVRQLNPEIPSQIESIIENAIQKDRDQRYRSATDIRADLERLRDETESRRLSAANATRAPRKAAVRMRTWSISALVLVIVAVLGVGLYKNRSHSSSIPPSSREPLIIAEFRNATADPVFDDTLRSVAITELDRSPVVEVVDQDRVSNLLRSLGQAPDARLTPDLARQVCVRGGGKLLAEGAIKPKGSAYSIEITVIDCFNSRVLSREQADSNNIDGVLTAVSRLAAATRMRLSGTAGAALDPAPLQTSSVQAYKAYLTGYNLMLGQPMQALAMLKRATQFDSDFADAWYFRGLAHRGLGETEQESEDLKRAFALRNSAPGMEKQRIEAMYYLEVTGEVYKAIDALRAWESLEPNQFPPHNLLALPYTELGSYEKASDEYRLTMDLAPEMSLPYLSLARALQAGGQYDEAEEVLRPGEEISRLFAPLCALRDGLASFRCSWPRTRTRMDGTKCRGSRRC